MKTLIIFLFLFLTSCVNKHESEIDRKVSVSSPKDQPLQKPVSLFTLQIKESENFVKIDAPKESDFVLPDILSKTEPQKYGDFNADGKKDVVVYLGACGTGGCMYALFLNQYDNHYNFKFL